MVPEFLMIATDPLGNVALQSMVALEVSDDDIVTPLLMVISTSNGDISFHPCATAFAYTSMPVDVEAATVTT